MQSNSKSLFTNLEDHRMLSRCRLLAFALSVLVAGQLNAASIPVPNGNFDASNTDWQFDDGINYGVNVTTHGIWAGFSNLFANETSLSDGNRTYLGNGVATRILSNVGVLPNFSTYTKYTLSWQVGTRSEAANETPTPNDQLGIYYFDGSQAVALASATITSLGYSGNAGWEDVSIEYTTGGSGPAIGQPILIGYFRAEDLVNHLQTNLDDARLDAVAVPIPEPGTMTMLVLSGSIVGAALRRRHRRRC